MATATITKPTAEQEALRKSLQVEPPESLVEWLNLFVYGDAGVGKTHLIGTAMDSPELHPLLIFDVDGGMQTLRKRKGIDVKPVRSMQDLEDNFNKLYSSIKDNRLYYKTIAIDTLTELADLDMRHVMKIAEKANPDKVDIDVPSPREWGKVRNHIRLITRGFRDLPCHVIFTGHVSTEESENQPTKYFPGFAGKLKREIPGFVDIVGYMTSDAREGVKTRSIQFLGTKRVIAKDRTSALGDSVDNPTLPMLWDLIKASQ